MRLAAVVTSCLLPLLLASPQGETMQKNGGKNGLRNKGARTLLNGKNFIQNCSTDTLESTSNQGPIPAENESEEIRYEFFQDSEARRNFRNSEIIFPKILEVLPMCAWRSILLLNRHYYVKMRERILRTLLDITDPGKIYKSNLVYKNRSCVLTVKGIYTLRQIFAASETETECGTNRLSPLRGNVPWCLLRSLFELDGLLRPPLGVEYNFTKRDMDRLNEGIGNPSSLRCALFSCFMEIGSDNSISKIAKFRRHISKYPQYHEVLRYKNTYEDLRSFILCRAISIKMLACIVIFVWLTWMT